MIVCLLRTQIFKHFFLTFLSTSVRWIFESNVRQYLQRKTILQCHTIFYNVTLSRLLLAWRTFSILVISFLRVLPTLLINSSPNNQPILIVSYELLNPPKDQTEGGLESFRFTELHNMAQKSKVIVRYLWCDTPIQFKK